MIYEFYNLCHQETAAAFINGRYVTARPLRPKGLWGIRLRFRKAWLCLMDRADVVIWPEGQ